MSERRHKQNRLNLRVARLVYLQSEGEYGEPPRKRPIPARTIGKAPHIRAVDAGYPNRAQRRGTAAWDDLATIATGGRA